MGKVSHDSEVLAEGQQVFTACAFIHQDFDGVVKALLPRRAATKKFLPDVFELPGGHVDFGEDMVSGLKREVLEEFGVNIKIGDPFGVFTYTNEVKKSHSIEVIYFAQLEDSIDDITINPEDHSEYVWISEADLPQLYTETKAEDDIEFVHIKRGFRLLAGDKLNFK